MKRQQAHRTAKPWKVFYPVMEFLLEDILKSFMLACAGPEVITNLSSEVR